MLLNDTFILDDIKILESKSPNTMRVRGTFQRSDEANNNKRIYPHKILLREMTKLQERIIENRLLGELDHPLQNEVKLSNVSHMITGLKFEGKTMIGEATLLSTPMGQVAQRLINDGVKIGISSRGTGTLSDREDGCKIVNEDYNMVTFDLVADPSTKGAFPGLTESIHVQELIEDTLSKINKEKVFVTLLKERLEEGSLKDPKKRAAREAGRKRGPFGWAGTSRKLFRGIKRAKAARQERDPLGGISKVSSRVSMGKHGFKMGERKGAGPKGKLPESFNCFYKLLLEYDPLQRYRNKLSSEKERQGIRSADKIAYDDLKRMKPNHTGTRISKSSLRAGNRGVGGGDVLRTKNSRSTHTRPLVGGPKGKLPESFNCFYEIIEGSLKDQKKKETREKNRTLPRLGNKLIHRLSRGNKSDPPKRVSHNYTTRGKHGEVQHKQPKGTIKYTKVNRLLGPKKKLPK